MAHSPNVARLITDSMEGKRQSGVLNVIKTLLSLRARQPQESFNCCCCFKTVCFVKEWGVSAVNLVSAVSKHGTRFNFTIKSCNQKPINGTVAVWQLAEHSTARGEGMERANVHQKEKMLSFVRREIDQLTEKGVFHQDDPLSLRRIAIRRGGRSVEA